MFPLPALVSFLLLVPSGLGRPQDYQDGQPSDIVNGGTTEAAVESSKATDLVSEATAMATEWQTEVGAEGEASETSALGSSVTAEPTTSAELPSESSATTTPVDEVPAPPVPSVGDLGPVPYMILRSKRHPAHCLAIDDEPSIWGPAKYVPRFIPSRCVVRTHTQVDALRHWRRCDQVEIRMGSYSSTVGRPVQQYRVVSGWRRGHRHATSCHCQCGESKLPTIHRRSRASSLITVSTVWNHNGVHEVVVHRRARWASRHVSAG